MKKIGIALIIIGVVGLALDIFFLYASLPSSGPWAGKIIQFHPLFHNHGLWTIGVGVASVLCVLLGGVLAALGRNSS